MVFLVECNPDMIMARILTSASRRNIVHVGNKSRIVKRLINSYENSKGVVDEDPGHSQPKDLRRFREVEVFEEYAIKISYYADKNNYLVILCPRLEEWILRAARKSRVDVRTYGLPNQAARLHSIINLRIDSFEKLVIDLMRRSRCVKSLARILLTYSYT